MPLIAHLQLFVSCQRHTNSKCCTRQERHKSPKCSSLARLVLTLCVCVLCKKKLLLLLSYQTVATFCNLPTTQTTTSTSDTDLNFNRPRMHQLQLLDSRRCFDEILPVSNSLTAVARRHFLVTNCFKG